MQDYQKIIDLIEKHKAGTISAEEKGTLDAWYNQAASSRATTISDEDVQESLHQIALHLPFQQEKKVIRLWPKLVAAASLLLVAAGMIYYFVFTGVQNNLVASKSTPIPGSNQATLLLASGKKFELNSQQKGIIVKDNKIQYTDGNNITTTGNNNLQYMQLITPKGGQYKITLPDGTQVWLNAASKLTYPDHFENDVRQVTLEGEAYFDVSKSIQPFIVQSHGQQVLVLGTTFNIKAYDDESSIETALLSGSVKVNGTLLQPGFETHLTASGITVERSDLKAVTAWKDGIFYFKNANIKSVMNQLKRWYNIEVEYKVERNGDEFTGQFPRDKPFEKVLEILQLSGINLKMEGSKLVVY